MKKILYILRHAKTEAGAPSQDDHDRALMERGVVAAGIMGKYMVRHHIAPDKVLCSTAVRTRQTWDYVQEAYKKMLPVEYSEQLYLASANEILRVIAATHENIKSLLVIGHNPGMHELCVRLARSGDEKLLNVLAEKFPTCALATIVLDTPWREIGHVRGVLKGFVTPKQLPET